MQLLPTGLSGFAESHFARHCAAVELLWANRLGDLRDLNGQRRIAFRVSNGMGRR